jgi:large subunit ribosomal protein L38e
MKAIAKQKRPQSAPIQHHTKKLTNEFPKTAARIKRAPAATSGPKNNREQIKFKIRAKRHLHTLILNDSTKADKIKQSLPPGMSAQS